MTGTEHDDDEAWTRLFDALACIDALTHPDDGAPTPTTTCPNREGDIHEAASGPLSGITPGRSRSFVY